MNTQGKSRGGVQNRAVLTLVFIVMGLALNGCGQLRGLGARVLGGLGNGAVQIASAQGPAGSPLGGDISTDLTQQGATATKIGGNSANTTKAEPGNPQGGGDEKGGDGDTIGTPSTKHPAGNGTQAKG